MSELTISSERLTAFALRTCVPRSAPRHHRELPAPHPGIRRLAGRLSGDKGDGGSLERASAYAGLCAGNGQCHAGGAQRPVSLSGLGRVPGKISESPAPAVPGRGPGADTSGVRTSDGDGPFQRTGAAGAAYGDDLRYRHPCLSKCSISPWRQQNGAGRISF